MLEHPESAVELEIPCNMMCEENELAGRKQDRIAARLRAMDAAAGGRSTMKAEVPYDPLSGTPYMSLNDPTRATTNWFIGGHRRPDVIITDGSPPFMENIKSVVEMKFNPDPSNSKPAKERLEAYKAIFGEENLILLEEGKTCLCEDDDGEKETVPATAPLTASEKEPESGPNLWMLWGCGALGRGNSSGSGYSL